MNEDPTDLESNKELANKPKPYHDLKINYPYQKESEAGVDYYVVEIKPLPEFGREKTHLTGIDFLRVCQEIIIDIAKKESMEGDDFKMRLLKENHGYYHREIKYPQEEKWVISLRRETITDSDIKKQYKWNFELNGGAFEGYLIGNWYYDAV